MAAVVVRATDPALAAIKLAWWREQLERLDAGAPPAEPRLRAASEELLTRGISGRDLAMLATGWATLLDERPDVALIEGRGETLFDLAARLIGATHGGLPAAGRLYARMDVTRRRLADLRSAAVDPALPRFPPNLRPLTAVAALARRDLVRGANEPEATPGRSWALMRHRMSGIV